MNPATFAYVYTAILAVSFIAAIAMFVAARLLLQRRKYRKMSRIMAEGHARRPIAVPDSPRPIRLSLRSLTLEQSERFTERWRAIEELFIDDPRRALEDADELVSQALIARGYPMREFEQRALDLSTDHREVVENYRVAHTLARKASRGSASAESLRCALQHYRDLLQFACETRVRDEHIDEQYATLRAVR
jgi:hypothetical protein